MTERPIKSLIELKDYLKERGWYESNVFSVWYETPIPIFNYNSPKDMLENGDLKQLDELLDWLEQDNSGHV